MLTKDSVQGIAIDYLTYVFDLHGIKIKYIKESDVTWPQALDYIKQHEVVDMVPTAKITTERKKHMRFTNEYIFAPWVIFTRTDSEFISSIDDLNGKTVSVEEGYVMHLELKRNYPGIHLNVVSADLENFAQIPVKDLSTGLVDAYIGNLLSTTYTIQSKGYTNVKVAAPTPFDNHNQAMAIRNDWPELVSIINKTLEAMTPTKHAAIRNKWLNIRYEYGISKSDLIKWIGGVTGISFLILGLILLWNTRLKKEVLFRKRIEKDLKDYQRIARLSNWYLDRKTDRILWAKEICTMFGVDDVHLLPPFKEHSQFFSPSSWERLLCEQTEAIKKGGSYEIELELIQKNGEIAWLWMKGEVQYNLKKEIIALRGVVQDITERKQAKADLKHTRNMFAEAQKIAHLGSFEYIAATQTTKWSEEEYRIYGLDPEKPSPTYDDMLENCIHPDDARLLDETFKAAMENSTIYELEHRIVRPDGSVRWVYDKAHPYFDKDDNLLRYVGATLDITQIKHAEMERRTLEARLLQAQKMESIGTLAGGIAHDFNNILSSIIGYTELAMGSVEKGSDIEDDLSEVKTAGMRAKDLVQQILTFARQSKEEVRPVQVDSIAKEVIKFITSSIPSTIEIITDLDSNALVMAPPTQIHQVLMNLCTNAAQAMEEKAGTLQISVSDCSLENDLSQSDLKPGDYVKVIVSDTGTGISQQHIHNVFEPYFTTKSQGEGTGLGLAVVHGIIENLKGRIIVESRENQGTRFTFYLPAVKQRKNHPRIETEKIPHGNENILLVDDEVSIAKIGSRTLEQLGYTVTSMINSVEALELFKLKPQAFDLVLTDMTMPKMTGDELAGEIIKIKPDIPIILCTGYCKKIFKESDTDSGVKAVIYKPIAKSELARIIRKVLDGPG